MCYIISVFFVSVFVISEICKAIVSISDVKPNLAVVRFPCLALGVCPITQSFLLAGLSDFPIRSRLHTGTSGGIHGALADLRELVRRSRPQIGTLAGIHLAR